MLRQFHGRIGITHRPQGVASAWFIGPKKYGNSFWGQYLLDIKLSYSYNHSHQKQYLFKPPVFMAVITCDTRITCCRVEKPCLREQSHQRYKLHEAVSSNAQNSFGFCDVWFDCCVCLHIQKYSAEILTVQRHISCERLSKTDTFNRQCGGDHTVYKCRI